MGGLRFLPYDFRFRNYWSGTIVPHLYDSGHLLTTCDLSSLVGPVTCYERHPVGSAVGKSSGIMKVIWIHPPGDMNGWTKNDRGRDISLDM